MEKPTKPKSIKSGIKQRLMEIIGVVDVHIHVHEPDPGTFVIYPILFIKPGFVPRVEINEALCETVPASFILCGEDEYTEVNDNGVIVLLRYTIIIVKD